MSVIDEFVLNYTLERLEEKIDDNKQDVEDYKLQTKNTLDDLESRTVQLENNKTSMTSTINSLLDLVNRLETELKNTQHELNKTRLANIKQEIVVRTLHNLQYFDAHDMHVDTFADGENIDWEKSLRGEWLEPLQAVGRTSTSYVKIQQREVNNRFLISGNGSSDEGIIQSFQIDNTQEIDKIAFFVEPHDANSWRDIKVRLLDTIGGSSLAESIVPSSAITSDWVEAVFPRTMLDAYKDYYIEITTDDPYGYRIGVDFIDRYLPGTSYGLFGGSHSDNNYDMGFRIWCYPAPDETESYIFTKVKKLDEKPVSIIFEKEDVFIDGTINYHVTRDGGLHWKILQPGIETNLEDLPEGKELIIRATITGNSYITAWGYVIKRGEDTW